MDKIILLKNPIFCLLLTLLSISAYADDSTSTQEPKIPESKLPEYIEQSILYDHNDDGEVKILAFGDSITRGVGDFTPANELVYYADGVNSEAGYPLRIEKMLHLPVLNKGVPGEKLSITGLRRFAKLIQSEHPDVIIFLEGANDSFVSTTYNQYFRNVQSLINISRAFNADIVISTIPSPSNNHIGLLPYVNSYNNALRDLSKINNISLADSSKAFLNVCKTREDCYLLNLPEGLHPNTIGYDVIGENIIATLLGINLLSQEGPILLSEALGIPQSSITTVPDPVVPTD